MIKRNATDFIKKYSKEYPVIAITGPRQSGKTTLARALFPKHKYLSLENLDLRQRANDDPRGFLDDYEGSLILDEAQRAPGLFSYLQERVDMDDSAAKYVLTGSHQFLLMENITQSLAGRILIARLLPFSVNELYTGVLDKNIKDIIYPGTGRHGHVSEKIENIIYTGFYPRIHDKKLTANKWLENYTLTYIERDIRSLVNIDNVRLFENFIKICASYSGSLLNYASISSAVGITEPTVKRWISLLETSGIIFLLQPYYKNFSKRILKTPKLYFIDTGLLCFLLSIRSPVELIGHPSFGNIFETFIISEFYKRIYHIGEIPPLYYWRDRTGLEVDLVIDSGEAPVAIEIKSSKTYIPDFEKSIKKWSSLKDNNSKQGVVIYGGDEIIGRSSDIKGVPWRLM